MAISRTQLAPSVSQTQQGPSGPSKLPKPWMPNPQQHKPPLATWDKFAKDLFGAAGPKPAHEASLADVERVLRRAEKNGLSPGELRALNSIRSTMWGHMEGGADGAAYKKLNDWVFAQTYGQGPVRRLETELGRLTKDTFGRVTAGVASRLMAWVRDESSVAGAVALKGLLARPGLHVEPRAVRQLEAFLAKTPAPGR